MKDFLKKLGNVFVSNVPDTSPAGKVDSTDMAKVVKTGVLVGLSAAISYGLANLNPSVLGTYQPAVMLGLTLVLDFVNKTIKSNESQVK